MIATFVLPCWRASAFAAILVAELAHALPAQATTWRRSPASRAGASLAFDLARGRTVSFGGFNQVATGVQVLDETWEWDGNSWSLRTPAQSPPARIGASLAFDAGRGRTVMFGGLGVSALLADTWEWDGVHWFDRTPALGPPPRDHHALAYDWNRGRTVYVGAGTVDTWEWDGVAWTPRIAPVRPPPRTSIAIAYDVQRGRTVLFGGFSASGRLADTWEWDGSQWLARTPTVSPPARGGHRLAYDVTRGRTLLFGGSGPFANTWEWDGNAWQQAFPVTSPPALIDPGLCCDILRGRTVLFATPPLPGFQSQTWEWDGSNWSLREEGSAPAPRTARGLATDVARGRVVLFGGANITLLDETLEFDGSLWHRPAPPQHPTAREGPALAYDPQRARVLLFGGFDSTGARGDTWEWDGARWTACAPATIPPARYDHVLVGDTSRNRIVLFGGSVAPLLQRLADTWEWDGNDWIRCLPAHSPPGRSAAGGAFDSLRGSTVLFGGEFGTVSSAVLLGDTWEWDGNDWTQRLPAVSPSARAHHAMAYHATLGRTVLFGGGHTATVALVDTWEFDGVVWRPAAPAQNPAAQNDSGMAWLPWRDSLLLTGGEAGNAPLPSWEYVSLFTVLGNGCAGSSGVPVLETSTSLRVGGAFVATLRNLAPAVTVTAMAAGGSTTNWALGTLPASLTGFGLTGCTLYVSPDALSFLPAVAGQAMLNVQVPVDTRLIGMPFHLQGLTVEPGANAAGAILSNAIRMVVGR